MDSKVSSAWTAAKMALREIQVTPTAVCPKVCIVSGGANYAATNEFPPILLSMRGSDPRPIASVVARDVDVQNAETYFESRRAQGNCLPIHGYLYSTHRIIPKGFQVLYGSADAFLNAFGVDVDIHFLKFSYFVIGKDSAYSTGLDDFCLFLVGIHAATESLTDEWPTIFLSSSLTDVPDWQNWFDIPKSISARRHFRLPDCH